MSWGSAAEAGGSTAASGASTGAGLSVQAGELGGASSAATPASFTIDPAQSSAPASGGYSIDTGKGGMIFGPTGDEVAADGTKTAVGGNFEDGKMMTTLSRFQKGEEGSVVDAYNGFGNNPETYGYAYNKLGNLSALGKQGGGAAPITTNISYQQPENAYLKKRGY